jgi:hypothetical protein
VSERVRGKIYSSQGTIENDTIEKGEMVKLSDDENGKIEARRETSPRGFFLCLFEVMILALLPPPFYIYHLHLPCVA